MQSKNRSVIISYHLCLLPLAGNAVIVHTRDHLKALSKGGDNFWGTALFYFHILILIIITLSTMYWIIRKKPRVFAKNVEQVINVLEKPVSLQFILLGLVTAQLGLFLASPRLQATALYFSGIFLLSSYMWLVILRDRIEKSSVIKTIAFTILLIYTRIIISEFIAILEDPYWLIAVRVLSGIVLVLLGAVPCIRIYFHFRRRDFFNIFSASFYSIRFTILYLVLMIGLIILNQFAGGKGTPSWAAIRFLGLIGIWFAGNIALAMISSKDTEIDHRQEALSGQRYILITAIGVVAYLLLLIVHFINVPTRVNPDGLSYFTIAQHFSEGNFVVRGLWAPLLPALLAPFLTMGLSPTTSWQIFSGLCGIIWAISVTILAYRFQISRSSKVFLLLSVLALSYHISSTLIVPDVLSAIILTWYFYVLTGRTLLEKPVLHGILLGILGGAAYYSRHYNLPFVLAHLLATYVLLIIQNRKRRSPLTTILVGLSTTIIIVTPWIIALSARYGQFTFSTAWSINRSVIGPEGVTDEYRPCSGQFPCKTSDDVLFPWEDPPLEYFPSSDWNPFSNKDSFFLQHQIFSEGTSKWLHFLISSYGTVPLVGLLISSFLVFILWKDRRRRFLYSWLIATSFLYAIGYIAFGGGESRYHVPYTPLLLMVVYWLIDYSLIKLKTLLSISEPHYSMLAVLLLGLPMISLVKLPKIMTELQTPEGYSCNSQDVSVYVENVVPPMIGSGFNIQDLAFQIGMQTYGALPPETDPAEANQLMHELSANTFITLTGSDLETGLMEEFGYRLVGVDRSCEPAYSILLVPHDE